MRNIDKRALREAAEKATPGRIGDRIDGSGSIKYQCFGNDGSLVLQTDHKNMEYGFIGGNNEADELFFRLCDPSTVLALLDELEAAEKRIAELDMLPFNPALLDVISERQRQQSVEGWTPEHDDLHDCGELAGAAACYAEYTNARGWVFPKNPGDYQSADEPNNWPWDPKWWKPTNPRRDLVKAGALILAEIERIDRAAAGKGDE